MSTQPTQEPAEGWRLSGASPQGSRALQLPPTPAMTALIVVVLLLGLLALPGPYLGAALTPPATPAPPTAATATPEACWQGDDQRGRNAALAIEQRWDYIVAETGAALRQARLCPGGRLALEGELLTAQVELLLGSSPPPYDQRRQQAQRQRYDELRAEAQDSGALFPAELNIAQRAYASGDFLLSVGAYEEAWRSGAFQASDQEQIRQYTSGLYNLGYWWTRAGGPSFQAGLAMLATSNAVDQTFHVGSGAAEELLTALLGADQSTWPAPGPSPLLGAKQTPG